MIKGKNITLRNYLESDLDSVISLKNSAVSQMPYNGQAFCTQSNFVSRFHQTGFWGQAEGGGKMLICGHDDSLLGEIGFSETSSHTQTLFYMLFETSNYSKGFTTEALKLFTNYLLSTFSSLNRLQLFVHVENIGSIRVAEKCKFNYEGLAQESLFLHGKYCDQNLYSLLRRNWSIIS